MDKFKNNSMNYEIKNAKEFLRNIKEKERNSQNIDWKNIQEFTMLKMQKMKK
jgi:hypothetical protein